MCGCACLVCLIVCAASTLANVIGVLYMRNPRSVLTGVCPVTVVLILFEFCVCVHRVVVHKFVHVCGVCSV